MSLKKLITDPFVLIVCSIAITAAVLFGFATHAASSVSFSVDTPDHPVFTNFDFFRGATTTNATSTSGGGGYLTIAGAKKVTMYFSRGGATGANTGVSQFRVEVTPDGTNWYPFNMMVGDDVSRTATSTVSISAATSTTITSLNLISSTYFGLRCIVKETTDGDHTCVASAEF